MLIIIVTSKLIYISMELFINVLSLNYNVIQALTNSSRQNLSWSHRQTLIDCLNLHAQRCLHLRPQRFVETGRCNLHLACS